MRRSAPRTVRGTTEDIAARQNALGAVNRRYEVGLPFDDDDQALLAETRIRNTPVTGDAPTLF